MMTARIAGGAPLRFYGEPLHFVSSAIDPALFIALKGGAYTPFSRDRIQEFLGGHGAVTHARLYGACIYIGRIEADPAWLFVTPRRDRGEGAS